MAVELREALTEADREKVYALRHKVMVEELGRAAVTTANGKSVIHDDYDDRAMILIAEDHGEVVGSVRKTFGADGPLEEPDQHDYELFAPHYPCAAAMTAKLVVLPSYRNTRVVGRLAMMCYELGRARGIRLDFVDSRPHLVRLYQQLGYRLYRPNIKLSSGTSAIPMVLLSEDVDHMTAVRSPFRRLAQRFENTNDTKVLFTEKFPAYAALMPSFLEDPHELWERWGDKLLGLEEQPTFLRGMGEADCQAIFQHLDPLEYPADAKVFNQDDFSDGLFCILSGQVEVLFQDPNGQEHIVAVLGRGELFGEMGFIRSAKRNATVRTREATTLLVLNPAELKKLEKNRADLAVKLMQNLFETVVARYETLRNDHYKAEV